MLKPLEHGTACASVDESMKTEKTILARGYRAQNGFCECDIQCDTIAEAKRKARFFLTNEHMHLIESSEPMTYSQVVIITDQREEIHSDFFRA